MSRKHLPLTRKIRKGREKGVANLSTIKCKLTVNLKRGMLSSCWSYTVRNYTCIFRCISWEAGLTDSKGTNPRSADLAHRMGKHTPSLVFPLHLVSRIASGVTLAVLPSVAIRYNFFSSYPGNIRSRRTTDSALEYGTFGFLYGQLLRCQFIYRS